MGFDLSGGYDKRGGLRRFPAPDYRLMDGCSSRLLPLLPRATTYRPRFPPPPWLLLNRQTFLGGGGEGASPRMDAEESLGKERNGNVQSVAEDRISGFRRVDPALRTTGLYHWMVALYMQSRLWSAVCSHYLPTYIIITLTKIMSMRILWLLYSV